MLQAIELGFDVREGKIDFYGVHLSPGQWLKDKVHEGDKVTLKKSGQTILVQVVRYEGAGFVGTVYGFEHLAFEIEFEGVNIGDEIFFFENHIFTCGHKPE